MADGDGLCDSIYLIQPDDEAGVCLVADFDGFTVYGFGDDSGNV